MPPAVRAWVMAVTARARISSRTSWFAPPASSVGIGMLTAPMLTVTWGRARIATAQQLRETTRGQTVLAHVNETQFLLADLFATPDASVLLDRVRGGVTAPPGPGRAGQAQQHRVAVQIGDRDNEVAIGGAAAGAD